MKIKLTMVPLLIACCSNSFAVVKVNAASLKPSNIFHSQNPYQQYQLWVNQMKKIPSYERYEDLAALGTVTQKNEPDVRSIEIYPEKNGFVFYTGKESVKAKEIQHNPHVFFTRMFFDGDDLGCKQIQVAGVVDSVKPLTTLEITEANNQKVLRHWQAYHIKPNFFQFSFGRTRVNGSRIFERISYRLVNNHWVTHKDHYYGYKVKV
ncbi:MAG: hypothetical protein A3F17_08550 [Gammaproteobacteria bacterium RIFCSPHIGHO2_12_FULL_41_15]|nr:MAG: hypothetical protein A3F17_08550 [Gammaproteobacteria bacterium RIFCSPHIGHO2_12_FULL_41_15]